ncbi:NFAT activation molecule 1 isoform X2 [Vulpes vulpes]|uniref:NFAT activation molecule 1 isoform X2 n=1 Tax=Vulpes vulpes TaxID=9627 RepID=A0ABM4Z9L4_VULVU
MESRPPRRWAPPAASWGPWLLGLLLFPWTLQLTGGQSVTHSGDPILVSLANKAVSFNCKITYSYTPEFKDFTVWYFHVDLKSQRSLNKQVNCPPTQGKENQTYTLQCQVTLKLPNASATGTYYCCVNWPNVHRISDGVFILVRDTGYRGPPQNPQKLLLLCFTGLLTALSILVTALLLWKKVLQHRDTEVYSCIQNEARSLPPTQSLLSQEKLNRFLDDSEFNLVYENL